MATRTDQRSDQRTKVRAKDRVAPERSAEFDHLALSTLRTYRQTLTAEENRVSYWRRLIHARLDLIDMNGADDSIRLERLRLALSETRVSAGRQALVQVLPIDDVPPLPDLASLWMREAHPEDPVATANLRRDLAFAELQLSAYRGALHRRLSDATNELIARYREEPALALLALPLSTADRL